MSVWDTANSECSPDLLLQLENLNWWIIIWHRVIKHQIVHSGNDFIILIVVPRGVAGFRCLPAINGNLIIRCSSPKMWGNVNWNKPHLLRVKRSKYCQQCWNHIFGWQIILGVGSTYNFVFTWARQGYQCVSETHLRHQSIPLIPKTRTSRDEGTSRFRYAPLY